MFAGDDDLLHLPGEINDGADVDFTRAQNASTSANNRTINPNDYAKTGSADALFERMADEEDIMRKHINARKNAAGRIAAEVEMVTKALLLQGYSQDQINEIFNAGMLTPEIIEELINSLA